MLLIYLEDGHIRFHCNIGKYLHYNRNAWIWVSGLHCINVEGSPNILANIVAAMFRVNDFATDFGSSCSAPILDSVSQL
jgi:hypothetical protein